MKPSKLKTTVEGASSRAAHGYAPGLELNDKVGNHSIMRDRSGGKTSVLTMKQLRERIQQQGSFDAYEWGGCGCAIE